MIRKIIAFIGIFFAVTLQGYNGSCINDLASRNFSILSIHNVELSNNLKKSLDEIQKSEIELDVVLAASDIKEIFTIDVSTYADESIQNSVQILQYLILLSLYQKMFQDYIVASETFLNDLLIAKKYWMYEDFYMKQPFFGKNIVYNFYSSEYQNQIIIKLTALYEIENNIAGLLGFCLYGLSSIQQINNQDVIIEQMKNIIDQFSKLFNTPLFNDEAKRDPIALYNHALCMNDTIKHHMDLAQSGMQQNSETSFLIDHWVGISCTTLAVITTALIYVKYEKEIKSLCQQGKIAAPSFWQEYIVNPLVGLKEVAWNQKTKKLQHVEHFPDIPQFSNIPESAEMPEYDGYSTWLVNPILNPVVKEINTTKKELIRTANEWKNDIVKTANTWKDASEKTLNTKIDEANDTIIKNNQINMYLATLGPVLFGTYWIGSSVNNAYDRHIKHKNWYLPMRYIIRSIDQLVNQVARSSVQHSFVDDGKLYMLVQHFEGYIACLSSEERFLMHHDIHELLSYDLNYAQKKGIIDRMYKTYEFLK